MSFQRKPILLFGAGGLAADILDIVTRADAGEVVGLVVDHDDSEPEAHGHPIHKWSDVKDRADAFDAVNAIGRPHRKAFIETAEKAGFMFRGLVDPSAIIFPSAQVADNAIIGAGVIVAASARIGSHVFLNRGVLIGHHTILDPFVSVQAGAQVGGHGRICEQVEVGIGATIIDRITVETKTMIGAGAVVLRDCPPNATMIGVPARAHVK